MVSGRMGGRYRQWSLVGMLLSVMVVLTGCWDRVEINDRTFVTAAFIDLLDNGQYEVSLGFPLPNRLASTTGGPSANGGGGKEPYTIVTKSARSIPEAVRKIRSDLSREISWGHTRVVVFGRKMAEQGIGPMIEMSIREPTFHIKTFIMVAPDKAKDISYLTPVFERFPSEVLREYANRDIVPDSTIKDAAETVEYGGDFLTPLLTMGMTPMLSEQGKNSPWVGTNGAAVFHNGKMVGELDVTGMRIYLWLNNKMQNALITIKSEKDDKTINFLILKSKCKITPKVKGDKISFNIRVEAEDDVNSSESTIDLTDPHELKDLEEQLSQVLTNRIQRTLKETQDMGVDAFRLGRHVNYRYPKVWKQVKDRWNEEYAGLEINVESHIAIKRLGEERNPLWFTKMKE